MAIEDKNFRNQEGSGRINKAVDGISSPREDKQRDISEIDRQEGDMEHGELGGNFKKEIKNYDKENQ